MPEYIKRTQIVSPEQYLKIWKMVPQIEQLEKAGLFSLVKDCINSPGEFGKCLKCSTGELAKMLGITREALYNKIRNETEFKASEISRVAKVLNLTQREINEIFFAKSVNFHLFVINVLMILLLI